MDISWSTSGRAIYGGLESERMMMLIVECEKFKFIAKESFEGTVAIIDRRMNRKVVDVPCEEVKELVATWVRRREVKELNQMSHDEVLLG